MGFHFGPFCSAVEVVGYRLDSRSNYHTELEKKC